VEHNPLPTTCITYVTRQSVPRDYISSYLQQSQRL